MADGMELWQALEETIRAAIEENARANALGIGLAEANAKLRAAKAAKKLELKLAGFPVTLIGDLVYGDEGVNEAKRVAEVAQVEYDTSREAVLLRKKEADILREQVQREWAAAGRVV